MGLGVEVVVAAVVGGEGACLADVGEHVGHAGIFDL